LFGRFSKIHGLLAITLQTMSGMEEKHVQQVRTSAPKMLEKDKFLQKS